MNGNIVDLLKQQLAPQLVSKAAETLGLAPEIARSAVSGAIPAMLASFLQIGSTSGGASALGDAAAQAARTDGQAVPGSSNLLGSLLGEGKFQLLASALGSFAGLGSGQASSLLGMAAPMVLGFLGRQPSVAGQGPQGLMTLLSSQKNAIMSAMPSGLSSLLGQSGLLAGIGGTAQAGRDTLVGTVGGVRSAAAATGSAASARPWFRPALGALAAIVIICALWTMWPGSQVQETAQQAAKQATDAAQQATNAAKQATGAAQQAVQTAMVVGGVDLAKEIAGSLSSLSQTLSGITNVDAAKAALPQLQGIAGGVDKLKGLAGQLPDTGRATLAGVVKQSMPTVQAAVEKVYTIPGASDVLKPVIDPLMVSLGDLGRQPA